LDFNSEIKNLTSLSKAIRESTLKRLKSVPACFENWRPNSGSMSFADVAAHLIECDLWLIEKYKKHSIKHLTGKSNNVKIKNKDEYKKLLSDLSESGKTKVKFLNTLSNDDLKKSIFDDRFGKKVSFWWIIVRGNFDHEIHHRGELAVYLKLIEKYSTAFFKKTSSRLWKNLYPN